LESAQQANKVNLDDGYRSLGLQLGGEKIFKFKLLKDLLENLLDDSDLRIKAILNTNKGWTIFNGAHQQLDMTMITEADDNRIELIAREGSLLAKSELQKHLAACLLVD